MAKPAEKDKGGKEKKLDKETLQIYQRGMPLAKMKTALNKAAGDSDPDDVNDPDDPDDGSKGPVTVNCAIGLAQAAEVQGTKFKKRAVIFLHKNKAGQQLLAKLQDVPGFQKSTFAHGTARIDPNDKKIVLLSLNKENKGIANLLKGAIKGTGRKLVRLFDEKGNLVEEDMVEEAGEDSAEGSEQAESETQTEASEAPWNPAGLTARLTELVKQMVGVAKSAPDRVGNLKDLATQAQTAIKTGVENTATEAVEAFASALATVNQGLAALNNTNGPAPNAAVLAKSGLAWTATLKRVHDDVDKLQQAMAQHYDGKPFAGELERLLQAKVAPIMTTLDQTLAAKLDEAGKSSDREEQQKLLGEARQMIGQYESFVTGNDLLAQLDANPFVPLQTQKTLVATLGALKKSVG